MKKYIFISRNKKERYQYFYDYERNGIVKEKWRESKKGEKISIATISLLSVVSKRTIETVIRPALTPFFTELYRIIPFLIVASLVFVSGLLYGEHIYKMRCKKLDKRKIIPYKKKEHNEDEVWDSYRSCKNEMLFISMFFLIPVLVFIGGEDVFLKSAVSIILCAYAYLLPHFFKLMRPSKKRRDEAIELVNQIAED